MFRIENGPQDRRWGWHFTPLPFPSRPWLHHWMTLLVSARLSWRARKMAALLVARPCLRSTNASSSCRIVGRSLAPSWLGDAVNIWWIKEDYNQSWDRWRYPLKQHLDDIYATTHDPFSRYRIMHLYRYLQCNGLSIISCGCVRFGYMDFHLRKIRLILLFKCYNFRGHNRKATVFNGSCLGSHLPPLPTMRHFHTCSR